MAVATKKKRAGAFFGIPLPIWVLGFLATGLIVGTVAPNNPIAQAAYNSGTYFPKTVVTLAAFLIFNLLAGATAKLVLLHRERAGKAFGVIFVMYLVMAIISLVYVSIWIPILTSLAFVQEGVAAPSVWEWFARVGNTFANVLSQQPLVQALVGAVAAGFLCAGYKPLHPVALGFIKVGDSILRVFKWLLWYYPIMIMCLAIGIPMKFGTKGMAMYGQTVLWVAIVTILWSLAMIVLVKFTTKRSFRQILSYYGTVWPTGFGTSGSYDTLAVNVISAEHDLELHKEVAEVSIVFGTVLNKNCSTMAILLVTITVARLLGMPISETEIIMLIPPVMILGLESPGIPGGPGVFMSPIIGALLAAPDLNVFVTTFVTVYSGLIPMLTTAGNTTDDGVIGCYLQDMFSRFLGIESRPAEAAPSIGRETAEAGI